MLTLNWNIIWTFVNILILFFFLKKFLFKPVTEMIEKREELINNSLQNAEEVKSEAFKLKEEYEGELSHAGDEASKIINDAREKAALETNRQLKETREEAARILQEASKTIELERQKSIQNAQAEIAGIAMLAASKIINKNMDDDANKQFLGDFVKEVGASK
ncbi:F0F1 ATP synthase subunit B [Anaerocolumna sp. AGMB13025]|uniref:F0F1 ATP synthase subunit B n=1 Tax=Anaerocolumna sp. AGMB13025 TaxID=3039116 RepID=UPI00241FF2EF|nr:F0F1 ATP synthase subunit B [Anaerocolumna sp. AGMB13025]WFR59336.1 F0F1 ATP synthase subunit B [Anaerocolumna sp. AGMB13025]